MSRKPIYVGIISSLLMFTIYFIVMIALNPLDYVYREIARMWYWFLPLLGGFGLQVGLFTYIRLRNSISKKNLIASSGMSSVSMLACCAHHITDFLPLLGVSAITLFLVEYQFFFIMIGIFFNILGVLNILISIKKHHIYSDNGKLAMISRLPLQDYRSKYIMVFSVVIISYFIYLI